MPPSGGNNQTNALLSAIQQLTQSVQLLNVPVAQLYVPMAQLAPPLAKLVPPTNILSGLFVGLGGQVGQMGTAIGGFVNKMHPLTATLAISNLAFQKLGQTIATVGQGVATLFTSSLPSAMALLPLKLASMVPVVGSAFAGLETAITGVASSIAGMVSWLHPELFQAISNTLEMAMLPALNALSPVLVVVQGFFAKVGIVVERLAPSLQRLADAVAPVISMYLDVMLVGFQALGTVVLSMGRIWASVYRALEPVFNFVVGAIAGLAELIGSLAPDIETMFKDVLAKAIATAGDVFLQLVKATDFLINSFVAGYNALIGLAQGAATVLGGVAGKMVADKFLPDQLGYVNMEEGMQKIVDAGKKLRISMDAEAEQRRRLSNTMLGPKGGIIGLENVWSKMQNAALGESQAEKEKRKLQHLSSMDQKMTNLVVLVHKQGAM